MKIENKLKRLRIKNKYTQQSLADKLYVSRKTVSSWENGRSIPNSETIKKLEKLYDTSILNTNDLKNEDISEPNKDNNNKMKFSFTYAVIIANIFTVVISFINIIIPFFPYLYTVLQLMLDLLIFNYFNKKIVNEICNNKRSLVPIIIAMILFTISQMVKDYDNTIMENTSFTELTIYSFIHAIISVYGFTALLFFDKLKNSLLHDKSIQ